MNTKKLEVCIFIVFVNDFEDMIKNGLKDELQKSWPRDGHNFFKGQKISVNKSKVKINSKG